MVCGITIYLVIYSSVAEYPSTVRIAQIIKSIFLLQNNLLDEAVKQNSRDVFEMMIVEWKSVFLSTLKLVILNKENE